MTGQRTSIPRRTVIAALALGTALTLTSCWSSSNDEPVSAARPGGSDRLVSYSSCGDLLDRLRSAASAAVGSGGLVDPYAVPLAANPRAAMPGVETDTSPAVGGDLTSSSGTNIQEPGVDEPDVVKTDGKRIVSVQDGVLHLVDATSRTQIATLALDAGYDSKLLLSGNHVLVIADAPMAAPGRLPPSTSPGSPATSRLIRGQATQLTLVDIASAPRVVATYRFEGGFVDARQVGSSVRVVTRSGPRLMFPFAGNRTDAQRTDDNRAIIAKSGLDDWLPHFTEVANGVTTGGRVDCTAVSHPATYTGVAMISVLSFDLAHDQLGTGDPVSVVADGGTVYASATSLYVASGPIGGPIAGPIPIRPNGIRPAPSTPPLRPQSPEPTTVPPTTVPRIPPPAPATHIYRFDISGAHPRFIAGGQIGGVLLNQYAMSEWNGHLRVATTAGVASSVYTFDVKTMKVSGQVGSLGQNQRIYAVRYVGPNAYVVTFRQVDPLYVIDLSDPSHPVTAGQLELSGYSSYLYPIDDTHLIGIGQATAIENPGIGAGAQVCLFDVSDPSAPKLVARSVTPQSSSPIQFDPHAFTFRPSTGTAFIPMQDLSGTGSGYVDAFHVTATSMVRTGQITPPAAHNQNIIRTLVVGADLWVYSHSALTAIDPISLRVLTQIRW